MGGFSAGALGSGISLVEPRPELRRRWLPDLPATTEGRAEEFESEGFLALLGGALVPTGGEIPDVADRDEECGQRVKQAREPVADALEACGPALRERMLNKRGDLLRSRACGIRRLRSGRARAGALADPLRALHGDASPS